LLWPLGGDQLRATTLQPPHAYRVVALDYSADGKTLASAGSTDQTVRLWDLAQSPPKERAALKLKELNVQVQSLSFTPDTRALAVLGSDKKIHVWDIHEKEPRERTPLNTLSDQPQVIGFSPDGKLLLELGARDGRATIGDWAAPHPQVRLMLGGPTGSGVNHVVYSVAFSPDGTQVAVGGHGPEPLAVWDVAGGKRTRFWVFPGDVLAVAFAPDGRHLFTANANGTVYILRLRTFTEPARH
jgi:WD40 repeat protein